MAQRNGFCSRILLENFKKTSIPSMIKCSPLFVGHIWFKKYKIGSTLHLVTVENEGLVRDPLLKM